MSANLRFSKHLIEEVVTLFDARESCRDIHQTGDIDASGDEVEIKFREFLKRWLTKDVLVTHGQIVDQGLNVSGQLDVIIADKLGAPPLYTTENGTQYVPFESVYAVGELKATYKLADLEAFCAKLRHIRTSLSRKVIAGDEIQIGDTTLKGFRFEKPGRPPSNRLFSFYFAVGAVTNVLDRSNLRKLTATLERQWPDVPSLTIVLSQCTIRPENVKFEGEDPVRFAPLHMPDAASFYAPDDSYEGCWTAIRMRAKRVEEIGAANLCALLSTLSSHLNYSQLAPAELLHYFQKAVPSSPNMIILGPIVPPKSEEAN